MQFNHRVARGFRALVSYTFSHSLDLNSTDLSNPNGVDGTGLPSNLYNIKSDYGDSNFDIRHTFSAGFGAQMPELKFENRVEQVLVNHWAIDGTVQLRSAGPFTVVYTPANPQYAAIAGSPINLRPDRVPGRTLYLQDRSAPGGKYLNSAAFSIPSAFRQGTEGRNIVRGFNLSELDLSARRDFGLYRETRLQFRADVFNIFNHPNFANPNANLSVTGFGYSPSMFGTGLGQGGGFAGGSNPLYQLGGPRSMQLSAKIQF
jgi:hypothetical protein